MRIAALIVLVGCAHRTAPKQPSERALFRDLERQVTVSAATGWEIDRLEVEGLMKGALDSVCRTDPLDRRALLRWIDDELVRLGGPVDVAWKKRGKDLDAVDDLLVMTRVRLVLARAEELSGDCPFWLEPQHPFRGRQISESRWQLTLGGGGKGIVVKQGELTDLSAGGAGRALIGRTFASGDGLYVGAEFGASASFPKDELGERNNLVIGADFVVPVVYRHVRTNTFIELEAGYLGHATEEDWERMDPGVHVGAAFGVRALRARFAFPNVALGMSWERTFVDGADLTTIKLGARVAFDLDL